MNEGKCRSCGAELIWAFTERGRRMPLTKASEGRRFIIDVLSDGSRVCRSVVTYTSHFTDCPNADQHRRDA